MSNENSVLNGYFYYTNIQTPRNKYKSDEKEFVVQILVSKTDAKAWKKKYPKQPPKEYTAEEFLETFKVEPPFESEEDEYYVIKLSTNAEHNGEPVTGKYRPKVFLKTSKGLVDVTMTTLVGNGSKGAASVSDVTSKKYEGSFGKLGAGIRVDELVEYQAADSTGGLGDLATETEDDNAGLGATAIDTGDTEEEEEAPKKKPKKVTKAKVVEEEEGEEEDSPF